MIAVIKTGGKQYSVKTGQILKVEKLDGKKGDNISLKNVLALSDSSNQILGDPLIQDATVEAQILDQIRDKKIIVFKKRKRQNYRSTKGHRQYLTVLKIKSINHGSKKVSISKEKTPSDVNEVEKNLNKKIIKKSAPKKKITKKTTSNVKTKKTTKKKKAE